MARSLSWDDLKCDIEPWIRTAIDAMGFETMTPVQASTIPLFSGNKDVVVESVTGSGKTIAFVIPVLERLIKEEANSPKFKKSHFHSLIISPTRELASQIQSVIEEFLKYYPDDQYPIRSQLIVGTGDSTVRDDINRFMDNRPQILVGTPGRILDFIQKSNVKTSSCGTVVLDEADRLLDLNFQKDVETILKLLPKQRRTGLFSATIESAGAQIFKTGMRNPVKVAVKSHSSAPSSLSINYIVTPPEDKLQLLLTLLNNYRFKKCIVYFPTCISVTYFYAFINYLKSIDLITEDISIFSLHGKLQTQSRMKTLNSFTTSLKNSVLFTTDVAARGIDIPDVDLVIQLDPPTDSDIFIHRCGRTGRANRVGKAIVLLNEGREEDYIPFLEVKNVILEEESVKITPIDTLSQTFKEWIMQDRARFDHGIRAYVAFIKYYSKHSASSIFRLQTMNFVGIAKFYGLLRLPKMPEITQYALASSIPEGGWLVSPPIDLDTFSYMDKRKEKERLQELKNIQHINDKKKLKSELKKKNMAWSDKKLSKDAKIERKAAMAAKRKAIEEKLLQEGNESEGEVEQDWKDLVRQNKKKKHNIIQGSFGDL
ncbi:ATP-dependent rRNA helicase SPB4 [Kluyveromyces marxianus]|uniref:ATP-dependent RNA helicase n=1 Tax=Kluyveromyces marxianus (strain DMKU3-1042 / BCC 29191 / NBRC 104275) TaxID=1003335 RepID=W0TFA9_KLUMD|nr:ATP-dependent rRNA helicase SPB4 [Kluyveromyces marxianus DMKU3-1042]BAO42297.1 ATP-dependent rRNA helicase SPB4 [Kluyveromyces marxianus DMKU3-1042]